MRTLLALLLLASPTFGQTEALDRLDATLARMQANAAEYSNSVSHTVPWPTAWPQTVAVDPTTHTQGWCPPGS